jgi:hypothetical protein
MLTPNRRCSWITAALFVCAASETSRAAAHPSRANSSACDQLTCCANRRR